MSFSCWVCCCILSKFYIKPQHRSRRRQQLQVVSYRNSTSNHNLSLLYYKENRVVSYRNSTSNHNSACPASAPPVLYLIEILHQTTTNLVHHLLPCGCILSKFYIKPQLRGSKEIAHTSCILSKFYIKPQPLVIYSCHETVVSYRNSTSNHNYSSCIPAMKPLYLIEILHQTTTRPSSGFTRRRLYLIEILHQTTTMPAASGSFNKLYLIEILHQTTTRYTSPRQCE